MYQRKQSPVDAFEFVGQPISEWPEWLTDHKVNTTMGQRGPSLTITRVMNIPERSGRDIQVTNGHWLVMERGELLVVKPTEFAELFERLPIAAEA